jgi:hypothetical protein
MSTYKIDADELVKSQYTTTQLPQIINSEEFPSPIEWLSANGMSKDTALNLLHLGAITVTYLD